MRTDAGGLGAVKGSAGPGRSPVTGLMTTGSRPTPRRGNEPIEHRQRVERARRPLWVVLDRLDRPLTMTQPLDGPIVQVDLADVEPGRRWQRIADDLDLV